VGVCPAFIFIPEVAQILAGSSILLGSQNVADQASGAFTGETSGSMLREFGCTLAIVGHSERRIVYGESNELVAARYRQAIASGLTPILCLGETLEQREAGATLNVLEEQLGAVLSSAGVESLHQAVIAYEPVWAIGTGKTATTEQAQEAHAFIRARIARENPEVAEEIRILYGGSVNAGNAAALFSMPDIDGGLVGGASLDAAAFTTICQSAG
jgi:triosephosphate isomerase